MHSVVIMNIFDSMLKSPVHSAMTASVKVMANNNNKKKSRENVQRAKWNHKSCWENSRVWVVRFPSEWKGRTLTVTAAQSFQSETVQQEHLNEEEWPKVFPQPWASTPSCPTWGKQVLWESTARQVLSTCTHVHAHTQSRAIDMQLPVLHSTHNCVPGPVLAADNSQIGGVLASTHRLWRSLSGLLSRDT